MTAFVSFTRTFAVWFYLLGGIGILFGIKMIIDARRLSRTTLFSLDHERAGEQSMRALALIVVMVLLMSSVTVINLIIAPFMPLQESPIPRGPTPTLANIFPTSAPTLTLTPTPKPTETSSALATSAPNLETPTRPPPKPTPAPASPTAPASALLPAPILDPKGPVFNGVVVTGENQMNNNLRFQWIWNCDRCVMGPNDRFVVVVTYTEKASGTTRTIAGGTLNDYLTLGEVLRSYGDIGQFYQKAQEDKYQWYAQVKRTPGDQPISLPSEIWKFVWH